MLTLYLARAMSGRIKADVVKEAAEEKAFFESAGFIVLDPVSTENVRATSEVLQASKGEMDFHWKRDKAMIREVDIVIDCTAHMNSEGTKHEIAYARYHLWKPVVRMFPEGKLPPKASIAFYEDDAVVDSRMEAIEWILRVYGSPLKRLNWKLQILKKSLWGFLKIRLAWGFDWV